MSVLILGVVFPWLMVVLLAALGCWISFQLIHQNGRVLPRLEALEQRIAHLRENLRTPELRDEFEQANRFRRE